jgi:hypothetical protein
VTIRSMQSAGALPRALVLAVAASLMPLSAVTAEERPQPGRTMSLRAAVKNVAVAESKATATARRSEARRAAQQSPGQDRSFFKTGPGILALAVMAIGTGYAIYSTQNDRIKSPGKE